MSRGQYMSIQKFYNGHQVPQSSLSQQPIREAYTHFDQRGREYFEVDSETSTDIQAKWEPIGTANTANPSVWGPAFWFSLHNGAAKYPINASPIYVERIKNFILGIPYILPCDNCSDHARNYIAKRESELNEICKHRSSLFAFFVDMHNMVNVRLNKPTMSVDEAYKIYSGNAHVEKFSYKT
jgi:hypothetical protein